MSPLGRCTLRAALAACAVIFGAALLASAIRILPWLVAPAIPWTVTLEFAKVLAAVAARAALFLGVPIGSALAAASFVERGEARALLALGVAPSKIVIASSPVVFALCAGLGLSGLFGEALSDRPSHFVNQLVARAKDSCKRPSPAGTAVVPLLGVTWLCFEHTQARIVGSVPGMQSRAWFEARDLVVLPSLDGFVLRDARFVARGEPRASGIPLLLRARVGEAYVSGLDTGLRAASLPASLRVVIAIFSAGVLSVALEWWIVRAAVASRLFGAFCGASASLCAFGILQALDHVRASPLGYVAVPLGGVAWLGLIALGWRRFAAASSRNQ